MSNLTVLPIEEIRMLYLTEKAKAEEIAFLCELLEEEDVELDDLIEQLNLRYTMASNKYLSLSKEVQRRGHSI